jgi:ubiquitin-like protein Pup
MAAVEHVQRSAKKSTEAPAPDVPAKRADPKKLKEALDAIIDDIDEVLDEEAVAMVNAYVQKGGQ